METWNLATTLKGAPLPPSLNNCYINLPRGGRAASSGLKAYKVDFALWAIKFKRAIRDVDLSGVIKIEYRMWLPRSAIYTKKNTVKRWDISNRIKPMEDCLATALEIDDSRVFEITISKNINPTNQTFVDIYIYTT